MVSLVVTVSPTFGLAGTILVFTMVSHFSSSVPPSLFRFLVGTCQNLANGTVLCQCIAGREGSRCQRRTDFCINVRCENDGVCQSRSVTYRCLCVSDLYSGVYCEIVSWKIKMYRICALTIACVAIAMIIGCATYIVTMDVLKYGFGIDAAKVTRTKKTEKRRPKQKQFPVAIHHRYVN